VGEPGAVLPQEYPLIAYYRGFCRQKLGESGRLDFEKASHQSTRYVFPNRTETQEVLEYVLKTNPEDPTAHFLLGSLYMSTGQTDLAIAEWKRARELKADLPVLHRNLGMALLHGKSDPRQASQVFKEGMRADPTNLDLYLGLDQALSLLESAPQERLEALESFPDQKALPVTLLHKLALTMAECGRPEKADRLFANRTFIREEFGTNIREVYLEIQLRKALASARQKNFDQARNLIQTMHKEIPGLAFTRDGLDPFLQGARFEYYLGEIESLCGNQQAARDFWQKATKSQDYRQLYFAYLAARRLGGIDEAAWRDKMRIGAAAAKSTASGGSHFPGIAIYAQGLLLKGLGQNDESNRLLREALYLPDKRMCHYLCRAALQERY
jgi:predicted Zn-dependent protease